MELTFIKEFFMWMTVLNLVIFILSAILSMLLKDVIVKIHGKMFGISPEALKAILYGYLGMYKIVFIVFVLVPWLTLLIIT